MTFDRQAALDAGYTEKEINEYLRKPIDKFEKSDGFTGAEGNPYLESVLQGLTFGFSDEMQAGLKSGYEKLTGDDRAISDIYSKNIKDVRRPFEKFQEEKPLTSLGLGLAGGIGSGVKAASSIGKNLPSVARYAKTHPLLAGSVGGATSGVIAGAGTAPTMEEIPEYSGSGALTGAILPGVLTGGGKAAEFMSRPVRSGIRKMAGTLDTPKQRAARMLSRSLARDDMSLSDVLARKQQLGQDAILADVGGVNTQRLAQTISSVPGKSANIAEDVLQSRMMKSSERLVGRMRGLLDNNKSAYRYMDDVVKERKTKSSPLYQAAFKDDVSVSGDGVNNLILNINSKIDDFDGTSIGRSLSGVKRSLVNMKGRDQIPKTEIRKLHAAKLDLDKKISDSIKEGKSTPLTAELMSVKRELLDVLDESDNYREARRLFSDDSSVLSSVKEGRKILKEDAEEMADKLLSMSDADKKGYIAGAMQAVSNTLKGAKEGSNSARRLATPLIKERLKNAFPDEASYNNFIKGLEAEDVFAEVRNNVLRGSQTQQRTATAGESAAEVGADLAQGRWLSTALDGVKNFFKGQKQIPEPVRDELAELLFKDVAQGKQTISRELAKRLRRHDMSEKRALAFINSLKAGVPVASGQIGATLEQE